MLAATKPDWLPLGALLVREGLITHEQLETALIDQQGTGMRLGELLVHWGWVHSEEISRALAEQYEMEFLDLTVTEVDPSAARRLPEHAARRFQALSVRFLDGGRLLVGVADPTEIGACDELRAVLGGAISLAVVDHLELERAHARVYARS